MVWDFDNKMKGADTNGTPATLEVTYEYDALGRRVARNEGSSQTVIYVQAGQQTICDYPAGTPASTSPTYRYVYASYIDEPILRQSSGRLRRNSLLPPQPTILHHRPHQLLRRHVERYAYSAYGEPVYSRRNRHTSSPHPPISNATPTPVANGIQPLQCTTSERGRSTRRR